MTRLDPRTIQAVARRVERDQGVRFPPFRVQFTGRMRDHNDYASFHAQSRNGRLSRLSIRLFRGEPTPLQRLALEHELTEIAGVMKGLTVPQAHRIAERNEKKALRSLPYRTTKGRPYKETLPIMRRFERAGPVRVRSRSWLDRLLGRQDSP